MRTNQVCTHESPQGGKRPLLPLCAGAHVRIAKDMHVDSGEYVFLTVDILEYLGTYGKIDTRNDVSLKCAFHRMESEALILLVRKIDTCEDRQNF